MSLDRRLKKLEVAIRPNDEELRLIMIAGGIEEDSPEYQRRIDDAKREAGLEHYEGELLIVELIPPRGEGE